MTGVYERTFYFTEPDSTTPFARATMQEAARDADLDDPGAWTSIEVFDPLPAAETDGTLKFGTTHAAIDPVAYYRIAWETAGGAVFNSDPVLFPSSVPEWTPAVADVAALLHARTLDDHGNTLGTFTTSTRPTAEQVEAIIAGAVADVQIRTGITTLLPEVYADARRLAALQAATIIEASYFPNEIDSDSSAYRQYQAQYLSGVQSLIDEARRPWALRLS